MPAKKTKSSSPPTGCFGCRKSDSKKKDAKKKPGSKAAKSKSEPSLASGCGPKQSKSKPRDANNNKGKGTSKKPVSRSRSVDSFPRKKTACTGAPTFGSSGKASDKCAAPASSVYGKDNYVPNLIPLDNEGKPKKPAPKPRPTTKCPPLPTSKCPSKCSPSPKAKKSKSPRKKPAGGSCSKEEQMVKEFMTKCRGRSKYADALYEKSQGKRIGCFSPKTAPNSRQVANATKNCQKDQKRKCCSCCFGGGKKKSKNKKKPQKANSKTKSNKGSQNTSKSRSKPAKC